MALPKFLQSCLWSYDLKSLDIKKDKELIITQVLNHGTFEDLQWLTRNYLSREIKKAIEDPDRGMWLEKILHYWQKIFDLEIDKLKFRQAIINLDPPNEKDFPRGHRTSLDFDFYTAKHFDPDVLFNKIEEKFLEKAEKISKAKDTLFADIDKVHTSYFRYRYPLIRSQVKTQGSPLASVTDIAAMKLIAITDRATKRDYIDIYFLLQRFDMQKIFEWVIKKYPSFNPYFALRALIYFEDIKESKGRIKVFDKSITWEKVKQGIFEKVKEYQLGMMRNA